MSIEKIIGLVLISIALIALLYIICLSIAKIEKEERIKRCKMYSTITKYLNNLMNSDETFR